VYSVKSSSNCKLSNHTLYIYIYIYLYLHLFLYLYLYSHLYLYLFSIYIYIYIYIYVYIYIYIYIFMCVCVWGGGVLLSRVGFGRVASRFFSGSLKVLSQGNLRRRSLQGPRSATTAG